MQIDGIELTILKVEKGEISKGRVCVKKNKWILLGYMRSSWKNSKEYIHTYVGGEGWWNNKYW